MPASWLDDGFPDDPKVAMLHDRAFRFHVTAICNCNQNLTDGHVGQRAVKIVAVKCNTSPSRWTKELVAAGLWRPDEDGDGFWIQNYLKYNLSAAEVKALRDKKREAGRRGAQARWGDKSDSNGDGTCHNEPHMPPILSSPVLKSVSSHPLSNYVGMDAHASENWGTAWDRIVAYCERVDPDARVKLERTRRKHGCSEARQLQIEFAIRRPDTDSPIAKALSMMKNAQAA